MKVKKIGTNLTTLKLKRKYWFASNCKPAKINIFISIHIHKYPKDLYNKSSLTVLMNEH